MNDALQLWRWDGLSLKNSRGEVILKCQGDLPNVEYSRLIAAAPALFAACKAAMRLADEEGNLPDNGEYSGAAIGDQISAALYLVD